MIEHISDTQNQLLAIIVRSDFQKEGISFFTDNHLSQQLAYMRRPAGYAIESHIHKPVPRDVEYTLETLFIKKGRVKVTFYDEQKQYVAERELKEKDVILLVSGGHGFEMIEDTEIIEVKQGPYAGAEDKERF